MRGAPVDRDDDDEPQIVDLRTVLAHRRGLSWRDRWGGPDRYGVLLLLIVRHGHVVRRPASNTGGSG